MTNYTINETFCVVNSFSAHVGNVIKTMEEEDISN